MNKCFVPFILFVTLAPKISHGADRITPSIRMDKNKPFPIFIHPGHSTTIDLPCSITSAVPGTLGDLKAQIGPEKDNSLLVWLMNERTAKTNLVVRCGTRVLVFDVIPNVRKHQDYINITGIDASGSHRGLIASSASPELKEDGNFRHKVLIKTSEEK